MTTFASHTVSPARNLAVDLTATMPASPSTIPPAPDPNTGFDVAGKHVYMIGIGGSGMSGLAHVLAARGAHITGSDSAATTTTESLQRAGMAIGFDQSAGKLPEHCDLIIASAAIKPSHPQMVNAAIRNLPTLNYAEALGRCMLGRTTVCIAGTHGKSTTTSMLGCIAADAGLDPTTIVGASCHQLHGAQATNSGSFRVGSPVIPLGTMAGSPGLFIAESCEFNRSFHNYHPTMAVITSVEADHLDVYGSLEAVVESFHHFASLVAPADQGGLLLIAHDHAHRQQVTAGVKAKVQTIGFESAADWVVSFDPEAREARLTDPAKRVALTWNNNIPGAHNAMNAATAAVIALSLGAAADSIANSLSAFRGVDRRAQYLGHRNHASGGVVRIYDDYGHHPTEVAATLKALRQFEAPERRNGRLICVFQPHQHSRTRHLLGEFADAFAAADIVIVPDIYFVRDSEEERHLVTAAHLVDRLRTKGVRAMHLYPFAAIIEQLESLAKPGDLLVVMGAGPVNEVAYGYLKQNDTPAASK